MKQWLYTLACVLVPLAWGILSTVAMRWIEQRVRGRERGDRAPDPSSEEPMWYI